MGLFGKKFQPVFSNEEFARASDTEIQEMLWQEEHLGLRLFSDEQHRAINVGRRATLAAVADVVKVLPQEGSVQPVILFSTQQVSPIMEDGAINAEDPVDQNFVEQDARLFDGNVDLLGEVKLRQRVKELEAALEASRRARKLDYYVQVAMILGMVIPLSLVSNYIVSLINAKPGSEIVPDTPENAERNLSELDREKKRGKILMSNFVASEHYRQTDNCYNGLNGLQKTRDIIALEGYKFRPKNQAACQDLAAYDREIDTVVEVCSKAVEMKIDELEGEKLVDEIKKSKEHTKGYLDKVPAQHKAVLKEAGYAQCQKVKAKK